MVLARGWMGHYCKGVVWGRRLEDGAGNGNWMGIGEENWGGDGK